MFAPEQATPAALCLRSKGVASVGVPARGRRVESAWEQGRPQSYGVFSAAAGGRRRTLSPVERQTLHGRKD